MIDAFLKTVKMLQDLPLEEASKLRQYTSDITHICNAFHYECSDGHQEFWLLGLFPTSGQSWPSAKIITVVVTDTRASVCETLESCEAWARSQLYEFMETYCIKGDRFDPGQDIKVRHTLRILGN